MRTNRFGLNILRSVLLTLLSVSAAQAVTLTWTDNNVGATYAVLRAPGDCSTVTTSALVSIVSGLTAKTYVDTTVSTGVYCYAVTATLNGRTVTSVPKTFTAVDIPVLTVVAALRLGTLVGGVCRPTGTGWHLSSTVPIVEPTRSDQPNPKGAAVLPNEPIGNCVLSS